jgi:DNA repair exonuclease SbcCD ATPase subunit
LKASTMQNNLALRRLVIYTNAGKVAYDEQFHKGINIICGDNSSGKSTITHFIFFALGGEFNDFVPEARECQVVYAEIEANGVVVTLKRYIEIGEKSNKINARAGLHIFWGDFIEALNPPISKYWQKYEYNQTEKKTSFSGILFELLKLPEVKEENNISIHQILRLLYIDQESPTSSLYYYDEFDKQTTREAVADLLLGIYNQDLYDYKLKLYNSEKELEEIKSEIRITKRFFPDAFSLQVEHIRTQIENKEKEIRAIEENIRVIRFENAQVEFTSDSKLKFQQLQEDTISKRGKTIEIDTAIDVLSREVDDSEYFIEALESKYRSLENSINTRDFLKALPLDYCPECLNQLNEHNDENSCRLCKQVTSDKLGITQAKRMQLEIKFQIEESSKLLKLKKEKLGRLKLELNSQTAFLNDLQQKVNDAIKNVQSFKEEALDRLHYDQGLAEGEILQYRTMLEQAEIYAKLLQTKSALDTDISKLNSFINTIKNQQLQTKEEVMQKIQQEGVYLLNHDLERQKEFTSADSKDLILDFSNNLVYLKSSDSAKFKQYQKFSASSNFYLKVSARFAIFLASLTVDKMRYPRFIFADNMEDKGIEEKRAQNLQQILIKRLNELKVNDYQLLYTTSYATEELLKSPYIVGEYYTKDNHSLKNID